MVTKLFAKLTVRELRKNWFEYLSMFLITILAVTLFLGFISNTLTLQKRSKLFLEQQNVADLIVQVDTFEDGDKEKFASYGAEYRMYSDGNYTVNGSGENVSETAKIFVTDFTDESMNRPYIVEGKQGVLIDARVVDRRGYKIGDPVTVELSSYRTAFSDYGLDATFEFPEITGLIHSVEQTNVYFSSAVFIAPELLREKILAKAVEQYGSFLSEEILSGIIDSVCEAMPNQALLRCDAPQTVKAEIESYFAGKEQSNLIFVYDRDTMESVVTIDNEVAQSRNMIYVFPVIFFFVALLVIMSTVSRLVLRERTNIGTFKALGIENRRIVFHYALMGTLVSLLGSAIGAALGPLIVPTVMGIKYTLMFSMPFLCGTKVSILFTVVAILFVCLCTMCIGVWASRSVIRLNPAECIRPKQIVYEPKIRKNSKSGAETHARLSLRMAMRNIRINAGRSVMTIVGILGCCALFLTSFGIGDTLDASIANDLGGMYRYDVSSTVTEEATPGVIEYLDSEESVTHYEFVTNYMVSARGGSASKTITFYVFEEGTQLTDTVAAGNTMSVSTAKELGLKAGDTVTFTVGAVTKEYTIDALVLTSAWNGFFTTENPFGDNGYSSDSVWVLTTAPDLVRDALNEINGTACALTMADKEGEVANLISSTNYMKYTLMVFAVLLSVVVLYNLSLLNMKERVRDMATLKVLGYTNFEIALSLIAEIMLLTIVGTALGCLCGFPLLYLVMSINEVSILVFLITLKPLSYLFGVLLSLGTAIVINVVFGLLISRISMTESLKSVE